MARQVNFHIISKLRYDSVLYIPSKNPDSNKHFRRRSSEKIDYGNISDKYLCKSPIEQDIKTDIYEATLLYKEFAQALNYSSRFYGR
jgi:putative transposase